MKRKTSLATTICCMPSGILKGSKFDISCSQDDYMHYMLMASGHRLAEEAR